MKGAFGEHAPTLIRNGYSPLPIRPGEKRPIVEGWNVYRDRAMSDGEIREIAATHPSAGIGVAGGFRFLVPIDVDTDEEDIQAAILVVLPEVVVAKKGRKGTTLFYRANAKIPGIKFRKPGADKPFLEILTSTQTVIPPTVHPETKEPYRWTTEHTLLDTPIDELPEIGPDHIEALRKALEPWTVRKLPNANGVAATRNGHADLERIRDALRAIPSDDRDIWLCVGMAIKSELGDAGFGPWREWSMSSIKFDEVEARKVWRSIKPEGGITIATLFELAQAQRQGGRNGKAKASLSFTLYRDIEPEPRKAWLVREFLGAGELSCFYGQPGAGKSMIVGDVACHVASGTDWFGKRVMHGGVLYVAAERVDLVKRRLAAFRKHHHLDDIPLAVVGGAANFRSSDEHVQVIRGYAQRLAEMCGLPTVLIIIETINRVMAGGDENSSKDMGQLIGNLTALQENTGAHILTVHHMPVGSERMRGHGSLLGACDTTVLVEREDDNDLYAATIEKANDGPTGEGVVFSLKGVDLHRDAETGVVTTAPVVMPTTGPIPERKVKLSQNERTMLGILEDAGRQGLTQEEWYAKARAEGIGERRRATLSDVRRSLERKELISEEAGIWRALRPLQPIVPGVFGVTPVTGPEAPVTVRNTGRGYA